MQTEGEGLAIARKPVIPWGRHLGDVRAEASSGDARAKLPAGGVATRFPVAAFILPYLTWEGNPLGSRGRAGNDEIQMSNEE